MSEKVPISTVIHELTQIMKSDQDYSWAWLCNISVSAQDEGLNRPAANRAAARFMKLLFDIDMTEHEHFQSTQTEQLSSTEEIYQESVRLAVHLWRKYYKDSAPDWKPLDTTMGVLSQIDNMIV